VLPDPAQDVEAVQLRAHHVEHDEIGRPLQRGPGPRLPLLLRRDVEALPLELLSKEPEQRAVAVDQEEAGHPPNSTSPGNPGSRSFPFLTFFLAKLLVLSANPSPDRNVHSSRRRRMDGRLTRKPRGER
jgi:hypothetical protein